MLLLGFEDGFDLCELRLKFCILCWFDDLGGIADDGAEELLFCDLF